MVSYLSDAPRRLLDGLLYIADGGVAVNVVWARDPGDWVWTIVEDEDGGLRVRIWEFGDDHRYRDGADIAEGSGALRCDVTTTLPSFATAIAGGFRRLIQAIGVDQYREQWDSDPFPMSLLDAVERWISRAQSL